MKSEVGKNYESDEGMEVCENHGHWETYGKHGKHCDYKHTKTQMKSIKGMKHDRWDV